MASPVADTCLRVVLWRLSFSDKQEKHECTYHFLLERYQREPSTYSNYFIKSRMSGPCSELLQPVCILFKYQRVIAVMAH